MLVIRTRDIICSLLNNALHIRIIGIIVGSNGITLFHGIRFLLDNFLRFFVSKNKRFFFQLLLVRLRKWKRWLIFFVLSDIFSILFLQVRVQLRSFNTVAISSILCYILTVLFLNLLTLIRFSTDLAILFRFQVARNKFIFFLIFMRLTWISWVYILRFFLIMLRSLFLRLSDLNILLNFRLLLLLQLW